MRGLRVAAKDCGTRANLACMLGRRGVTTLGCCFCLLNVEFTWSEPADPDDLDRDIEWLIIQAWRSDVEGELLGILFGEVSVDHFGPIMEELLVPLAQLLDDLPLDILYQKHKSPEQGTLERTPKPQLFSTCLAKYDDQSRSYPSSVPYLDMEEIVDQFFWEVIASQNKEEGRPESGRNWHFGRAVMAAGDTGRARGRVVIGGRGRALSAADVYNVAVLRYRVVLDRAALDTLEKEVKAAPAGKEDGTGVAGADSQEGDPRALHVAAIAEIRKSVGGGTRPDDRWAEEETRAAAVGKLIEMMRSRAGIGTRLVRLLEHFLNQDDWQEEPARGAGGDGAVCASLASPPCLSAKERAALSAGISAAIGIAAIAIHAAQTLSLVADGVMSLSCEALRAHVESFDAEHVHKCEADVASDLRTLLLGSKNVNPRQGGVDVGCVRAVPQLHGPLRETIKLAGSAVRAELNAVGGSPAVGVGGGSDKRAGNATMTEPSATVFLYLGNVVRCLSGAATASGSRCAELCSISSSSLVSSSPLPTQGRDRHIGIQMDAIANVDGGDDDSGRSGSNSENGGEGGAGTVSPQLTCICMADARDSAVARAKVVAKGVMELLAGGGGGAESSGVGGADGIRAALLAFRSVRDCREVFAVEAWMAAAVVREREAAMAAAPKKEKKLAGDGGGEKKAGARSGGGGGGGGGGEQPVKAKKGGGGGGPGASLGKGSALVRSYVDTCRLETSPAADEGESKTTSMTSSLSSSIAAEISSTSAGLDPRVAAERLGALLDALRAVVESNEARRKPKIPKGTRDFTPGQMAVREKAFGTIVGVFKRHGAVAIDTPVFELRETLMGKYGEDSKLIYDLADQGGEILSLRYDLTVPFARYLATHNEGNLKRYHIARVYRRDNPAKGRYREFYQCDFDIAGQYPTMVPDSEVLKVLTEILDDLNIGDYEIKLNHRVLLDATLEIAGVPTAKFRTICSAIDKLDKETPEKVKAEMVEEKGLSEEVAEKVLGMVLRKGRPLELLEQLRRPSSAEDSSSSSFMKHPKAAAALDDLSLLFSYLDAMKAIHRVVFDLSLARGLDYYTGVIYEAVFKGTTQVGSIAAGGRYDNLVGMFSGKQVPAVGVSLGIERVLAIMMEDCESSVRKTQTEVLVASIGPNLLKTRMAIASELWTAKIKAEFVFSPAPNLQKQLTYAQEAGIPWMVIFGGDEIGKGVVQIRDLLTRKQDEVAKDDLVEELKTRLNAGRDPKEPPVVVQ
ncbi:hypothetical protein CBR_g19630 [Chara braunii]|uniref:Histidine--tRNA ligase, cytoplasmic n=1 Tax=Chara braunii TaxID=69332 RepID=A0A388KYH5_CHABU|nr:hypothetical protein CBR_g19630 [Chara braunii]|eukprot:GBG75117.1 hypothetical protein CBR_g19630 [Chara braunii]